MVQELILKDLSGGREGRGFYGYLVDHYGFRCEGRGSLWRLCGGSVENGLMRYVLQDTLGTGLRE